MKRDFNEFLILFLNSFPSKFIVDYLHISSVARNGYIRDLHTVLSGAKRIYPFLNIKKSIDEYPNNPLKPIKKLRRANRTDNMKSITIAHMWLELDSLILTNLLAAKGARIDTPETYDVGSWLPLETVQHGCVSPCNLEHNAIAVTRHGSTTRSEGKHFLIFLAYNSFFK